MSYDAYEVPDGITPVVGFRGWLVKDDTLWSVYPDIRAVEWPVGVLQSECLPAKRTINNDDERRPANPPPKHYWAPHIDCTCGIYALHDFPREWIEWEGKRRYAMRPWPTEAVPGMVHGWGHVVMGTSGWRAQYAKPIALITTKRAKRYEVITRVAEKYGIEVITPQEARK